jgi:hypothetical protein
MQLQQQGQTQSPADIFNSIFSAQFFNNIIVLLMMFAMMKVFLKVLGEPARATSQVRETTASKSVTAGASLRENLDWSERQSAFQELELEEIPKSMENRSLSVALGAVGDITQELLSKQYSADRGYIAEKLTIVLREAQSATFKAKLSASDEALADKAINGYAELEFKTGFGRKAKALVMSVARQDTGYSKSMAESMLKELNEDLRFKK